MRADFPSGNMLTTRVLRLISLLSRSMALFVRVRRPSSRGIAQYDHIGKVGVSEEDRTALEGNGLRPGIWNCDITDSWKGRRPQWGV